MDTTGRRQRGTERAGPLAGGGRVETFPVGRICEAPDCMTVLSHYNPSHLCGRHRGWDRSAGRAHKEMEVPEAALPVEPWSDDHRSRDPGETAAGEWMTWVMPEHRTDRR